MGSDNAVLWMLGDQWADGASGLGTSNKDTCWYSALWIWQCTGRLNQPQRRVNMARSLICVKELLMVFKEKDDSP